MGHRKVSHIFDGYAKLAKLGFKKDGKTVTYTNKFLKTASYNSSVAKNDMAAYLLTAQPSPPFNAF